MKAKAFYGNGTISITNDLTAFEGKIRTEKPAQRKSRILSQPYSIVGPSDTTKTQSTNKQSNAVKYGAMLMTVPCTVQMVSMDRFEVLPLKYHSGLIDVFKTIPTRKYGELIYKMFFFISFFNLFLIHCPQIITKKSGRFTSKT